VGSRDDEQPWLDPYPTDPSWSYGALESVELACALQRARAALTLPGRSQQATLRELGSAREAELVRRFIGAWERSDIDALVALLAEDARFTMPPLRTWLAGRAAIEGFLRSRVFATPWKLEATHANGQLAFVCRQGPAWGVGALNVLTLRAEASLAALMEEAMSSPERPTMKLITLKWAPPLVRGLVRDLRARWALEEAGIPYEVVQIGQEEQRAAAHLARQPFGQVPVLLDGEVTLFESGALVQYIAERSPALLPSEPAARAEVTSWMFTAMSTLEPAASNLQEVDWCNAQAPWATPRRPAVVDFLRTRFGSLSDWLRDRDHVTGAFSAADILVTAILRMVRHTHIVAEWPVLTAYQARCEARPAFHRALADHAAAFARFDGGS